MGTAGSKFRFALRPFRNYDVEDRAFKVISRDKPTPAPHHPSVQRYMDGMKSDPNVLNKGKPNSDEMDRLNQVFVTSTGDNPVIERKQNSKLPEDRHSHEEWVYGVYEPVNIPPGKLTLNQVVELLQKHSRDPETYTAEEAAKEYNLDLKNVQNILDYYRPFNLYLPEPYILPEDAIKNPPRGFSGGIKNITHFVGKQFMLPDDKKHIKKKS